jgi:hypothetical protein
LSVDKLLETALGRVVSVTLGMTICANGRKYDLRDPRRAVEWYFVNKWRLARRKFGKFCGVPFEMATLQVNAGRAIVTGRLLGVAQGVPQFGAWGTGAGVTAAGDTTLFAEDVTAGYARASGAMTQATTTTANDTEQVVWTLAAKANLTITNAGLFDALTAGTLWMKGDFAPQALNQNDTITFTAKVQYS